MYCYTSKTFIVMQWREKRGFKEHAKLGEAVCDGVIVNFIKEKEHFKSSCSSVYYNAVFFKKIIYNISYIFYIIKK